MAIVVTTPNFGYLTEIEDEEDLFEIDLDAADNMPPPTYYWGSYFTSNTSTVLFANCLLPIADVSNAIPAAPSPLISNVSLQTKPGRREYLSFPEPVPLGKLLQLPYSRALTSYSGK